MQQLCIKLAVSLLKLLQAIIISDASHVYSVLGNANLCMKSDFIDTYSAISIDIECATMCSRNPRCQAFTINDGPCQLFVFDKCSKSVKDCSCSRRGQVFVKQQPGLEPGALCPTGYGEDLCGVKYKLLSGLDKWWPSRAKCESESGLVIMADVIDATEMSHLDMIHNKYRFGNIWLGGYQTAGSVEPRGGWYWVGCNITVNSSLWNSREPDNYLGRENVIGRDHAQDKLSDYWDHDGPNAVMCECVSPFG